MRCKSLVEIDLHGCENVTDKYLKSIFLDLTQLRGLELVMPLESPTNYLNLFQKDTFWKN